jgi:hypothetical protein
MTVLELLEESLMGQTYTIDNVKCVGLPLEALCESMPISLVANGTNEHQVVTHQRRSTAESEEEET